MVLFYPKNNKYYHNFGLVLDTVFSNKRLFSDLLYTIIFSSISITLGIVQAHKSSNFKLKELN